MIDKDYDNLSKDNFEFIQQDKKIYDKRFETKPIGYFKDAMLRFGRNRTNVTATIILSILILLSILVPMLTTKNYLTLEPQLSHLPPRAPFFEKLGIFDGTRSIDDQIVDLDTIDPETGLGTPGPNSRYYGYILMDSLENYTIDCTDMQPFCLEGQTVLSLDAVNLVASIRSRNTMTFDPGLNPELTVDIYGFSGDVKPTVNIQLSTDSGTTWTTIKSVDEPGRHTVHPFDELTIDVAFVSRVRLELTSTVGRGTTVSFTSVELNDDSQTEPVVNDRGYELHRYTASPASNYVRRNGEMLMSAFKFDVYKRAFDVREEKAFRASSYYRIIEENKGVCTQLPDPDNEDGWLFSEGCPVVKVIAQTEPTFREGDPTAYYSYHLVLDYMIYAGYEEIPYFYFGTTAAGRDFFALVWLGLRTSLLIGLIVASINISIGVVYGSIEGYYGGLVDLLMERFGEIIGRIPFLVWLALFVVVLGPGMLTLIVLLTITGWLGISSVTRTQFYRYKGREYVLASRTLGAKDSRLIFRHILPNGIGTIITASVLMIPSVIFAEAVISFLGFGIGHGQTFRFLGLVELSGVSIGVLLADGQNELLNRPYLVGFPAVIVSILMITFNMFGNALRDAFNPSLRGSE